MQSTLRRCIMSLICLVAFGMAGRVVGQSFTFSSSAAIIDTAIAQTYPLSVTGLRQVADTSFGLASVCVDITHTYDSDLIVKLVRPDGQVIDLWNRVGGSGRNFTGTCLAMDAVAAIYNISPPFTGVFRPDGVLANANPAVRYNPNGVWRLQIQDVANGDQGVLNSFTLSFAQSPPLASPNVVAGPCNFANMGNCKCPDGSDTCDLLPDMTASASILARDFSERVGEVRLSNATPNIGYGPLEVHGTGECYCDTVRVQNCATPCPNGELPKERIIQRVYRKTGNTFSTYDRNAGYMTYHPSHGHIHVENWSQFTLRTRTASPNPLDWPIIAAGQKTSFCLVNLADCSRGNGYCRDSLNRVLITDSMVNTRLGRVTGCSRDQGIYPGMADVYNAGLDGQDIQLAGVCNGTYYLVSVTDPDNDMLEYRENNNAAYAQVTLTRQPAPAPPEVTITPFGQQMVLSASNIPPGAFFMWDFGDGTVDSTFNPALHTYGQQGSYRVTLLVRMPCGTRTVVRNIMVTDVASSFAPAEFALRAVPNPSQGPVQIEFRTPRAGIASLALSNTIGQTVWRKNLTVDTPSRQSLSLDLKREGLAAGLYTLTLRTAQGRAAIKLMVE